MCLLEEAMLEKSSHASGRQQTYPINAFSDWARGESELSSLHGSIGALFSAHLYREQKAPLHHEYAVLGIGGDSSSSASWIRVERAAQHVKDRWYVPRSGSLGPIIGGAILRETITFASTKDALITSPADELASVTFERSESTWNSIFFSTIGWQLSELSKTRSVAFSVWVAR